MAMNAGRQRGDEFVKLVAGDGGAHECGLACRVDAVDGENILGEIDADGENDHGLPLPKALMRFRTSHRGTVLPVAATRQVRDGGVPFIR